MGMLDELLRLKVYRQDKAEMSLARCRLVFAEVMQRMQQAQQSLEDFQRWSAEHESGLYGAMYGRLVRPRDLEHVREDVVMLRVQERSLSESLTKVNTECTQAETAVRESRGVHELAMRSREKFVQLVRVEAEEFALESERKEDLELEDLYTIRRDREDWDEHDDD